MIPSARNTVAGFLLSSLNSNVFSMANPNALDALRSTRTRIAKPRTIHRAELSMNSHVDEDASKRDFSNYLGPRHPLRVIFVGHNPSDVSWECAAPYAHGSNRFWKLLNESNLAPADLCEPRYFSRLPDEVGIGFIDLFVTSGSDASLVGKGAEKSDEWRKEFLMRLEKGTKGTPPNILCCLSKIVAKKLLRGWNGAYGFAGQGKDWDLEGADDCEVWVLPSTSGRAGLKWEQRLKPFQELSKKVHQTGPWNGNNKESESL